MTEYDVEELKWIIHNEKMSKKRANALKLQDKINKQKVADEKMMTGKYGEYYDHLRKVKCPIAITDVKRSMNPPRHKILDMADAQDRLVNVHAIGYLHGLYYRLGCIALFWLVYVFG